MSLAERNALIERHLPLARERGRILWCRSPIVRRLGTIDDAVSESMRGLVRAAERWKPERGATFATFATLAIRHWLLRCARRNAARAADFQRLAAEPLIEAPDSIDIAERAAAVHEAVAQLPERLRIVATLRFGLDGQGPRKLREIAAALGVGRSAAKKLSARASEMLRGLLVAHA